MVLPARVRPSAFAGLCTVCAGTGMMPRTAPEPVRVPCAACEGLGAVR